MSAHRLCAHLGSHHQEAYALPEPLRHVKDESPTHAHKGLQILVGQVAEDVLPDLGIAEDPILLDVRFMAFGRDGDGGRCLC